MSPERAQARAARPLEFVREDGRAMLVLEDPGGEPLARLLGQPMEIGVFLRLAIGVAAALGKAHQAGFVHKDLKPGNILVNCADGAARLTGFGIATRLPRERQTLAPPETIAGTLAHMAPEQIGRMNRSIDLAVTPIRCGSCSIRCSQAHCHSLRRTRGVHCHREEAGAPGERVETVLTPSQRS
jgi:serine/threonine protein kinase